MKVRSPNLNIQPISAEINSAGHLSIGGCDTADLAHRFGTPLWVLDEQTIASSVAAVKDGLSGYPGARALYAGKAFLCLAMCHLVQKLGLGLDVVSEGEMYTAIQANFPAELIYMHGNNKSFSELCQGLSYGPVQVVVDSVSELNMLVKAAQHVQCRARVLFRVTPGVEPDTHHYIATGHDKSKFGIALSQLDEIVEMALAHQDDIEILGLHAHIGSQTHDLNPYLEIIEILADCFQRLKDKFALQLEQLDVGGGLGIAYNPSDRPLPIDEWSQGIANQVKLSFQNRQLKMPSLLLEPGRSIVGTAGITLYRAGHSKVLPEGIRYLAVDGGMADNPRPVTYQAKYSACVANRMHAQDSAQVVTIVGKYCESGDIIVKEANLAAQSGDLIAIFGTGAYNYSMASNYNRTGRPACVVVSQGNAELILERESSADLLRQDRVPKRFLQGR